MLAMPLAAVIALGCASLEPPAMLDPDMVQRRIAASPARVTQAAIAVFAEQGIPIAAANPELGLVQGQPITARGAWGSAQLTERFDCGTNVAGTPRAMTEPVTFTLGALAEAVDGGSRVRITATATAQSRSLAGDEVGSRCEIKTEYATLLLDTIASRATGG